MWYTRTRNLFYFRIMHVYCDTLTTEYVMLGIDESKNQSDALVLRLFAENKHRGSASLPISSSDWSSENSLFVSRCLHSRTSSTGRWLLGWLVQLLPVLALDGRYTKIRSEGDKVRNPVTCLRSLLCCFAFCLWDLW